MPRISQDATQMPVFQGYHQFRDPLDEKGAGHGSFEVFHHQDDWANHPGLQHLKTGWYWWPCSPGCLPDGEPSGPFPTAEGAYLDAIGD